tara:strand:- start:2784 stop:3137 length:354 start_codon:yes stop_codon:yes gene_type:complete
MDNICGICGDTDSKKYMHTLNCSHSFHYECLVQSFKYANNRNCPICRKPSDILPMVNSYKKPINLIHYDYTTSIDDLDKIKNFDHKKCDHIITRGKNKGKLCDKRCVVGFYKCSSHL